MYADVPPAPPGLIWWEYRPGVPPLPQPGTYFGLSNWTNWGWRYDPDYAVPFYQYSNIDKASCDVAATIADSAHTHAHTHAKLCHDWLAYTHAAGTTSILDPLFEHVFVHGDLLSRRSGWLSLHVECTAD